MALTVLLFLSLLHPSFSFFFPWNLAQSTAIKFVKQHALDEDCAADLQSLISDALILKPWAIKMADASTKIYPGMINGHGNLMGDYDQCLSVNEEVSGRYIKGQYCTVVWGVEKTFLRSHMPGNIGKKTLNNMKNIHSKGRLAALGENYTAFMATGICVPKSCTIRNVINFLEAIKTSLKLPVNTLLIEDLCVYKDTPVEYTWLDVFIYTFFITIFMIILFGTCYDIYLRYSGKTRNILVSFSAYSNAKKLFSCKSNDQNILACVDGFKVICTFWIILGHTTACLILVSRNPIQLVTEWKYNPYNIVFWSVFYGLDIFFALSGLLLTYHGLVFARNFPSGLLRFYLHRYIRLAPMLLVTVFIHTSIVKLFADGPFATLTANTFARDCSHRWWKNIFLFFNVVDYKKCVPHVWYIAIDSNLYLYSPLILFFLHKYPKGTLLGMLFALLVGVIYSFVITIYKDLGFFLLDLNFDYQYYLYHTVIHHLPSWIIGVFFGYLLKQNKLKIPRFWNLCLWIFSLYIIVILIVKQMNFLFEDFNVDRAAWWNGLARPAWSLAVCLMILSCATGNGGLINTFLSHPIFAILRKLSYGIYMLHISILMTYFMNVKQTYFFNSFEIICQFIVLSVFSVLCSIPFCLAFESPIAAWTNYKTKNMNKPILKT